MANTVGTLSIDMVAGTAQLERDLQDVSRQLDQFGSQGVEALDALRHSVEFLTRSFELLIGLIGAHSILDLVRGAQEAAHQLESLSQRLGVDVEQLQAYQAAMTTAGVASGEFDRSITRLNERIGAAVEGNKAAQQSFADLGIAYQAVGGGARDTESVLKDLSDRLHDTESSASRTRAEWELLGRNSSQVGAVLAQGSDALGRLAEEARNAGLVIGRDLVERGAEAQKQWNEFTLALRTTFYESVLLFKDSLGGMGDTLKSVAQQLRDFLEQIHAAPASVDSLRRRIADVDADIEKMRKTIQDTAPWFKKLQDFLGGSGAEDQLKSDLDRRALLQKELDDLLAKQPGAAPPRPGVAPHDPRAEQEARRNQKEIDAAIKALDIYLDTGNEIFSQFSDGFSQTGDLWDKFFEDTRKGATGLEMIREDPWALKLQSDITTSAQEFDAFGAHIMVNWADVVRQLATTWKEDAPDARDIFRSLDAAITAFEARSASLSLGEDLGHAFATTTKSLDELNQAAREDPWTLYTGKTAEATDQTFKLGEFTIQAGAAMRQNFGPATAAASSAVDDLKQQLKDLAEQGRLAGLAMGDTLAAQIRAVLKAIAALTAGGKNLDTSTLQGYLALLRNLGNDATTNSLTVVETKLRAIDEAAGALDQDLGTTLNQKVQVLRQSLVALATTPPPGVDPTVFNAALESMKAELATFSQQASILSTIKGTFDDVFRTLSSSLAKTATDFAKGTKTIGQAFSDMADQVVESILQKIIKNGLDQLETALLKFIESRAFQQFLSSFGLSFLGGPAGTTVPATVEPDLIPGATTPAFATSSYPALKAAGPQQVVNVIDQRSSGSVEQRQSSSGGDGRQTIELIILDTVKGGMNNGTLDRAIQNNYGINRRAVPR